LIKFELKPQNLLWPDRVHKKTETGETNMDMTSKREQEEKMAKFINP
jgi:hypothetical protein